MQVSNPFTAIVNLTAAAASTDLPTKILYDRKSAAFALSISVRSLDYLIANKQLNTRKLGKKIMIPHAELVRFARADHHSLTADSSEAKIQ
jgi:hypothetical protein